MTERESVMRRHDLATVRLLAMRRNAEAVAEWKRRTGKDAPKYVPSPEMLKNRAILADMTARYSVR